MTALDTPSFGDSTKPSWSMLYRSRGDEVNPSRPTFTGDVVNVNGDWFLILQHPCALRKNGVDLSDKILVAPVSKSREQPPADWHGHFKKMFLPQLVDDDHYEASFIDLEIRSGLEIAHGTVLASLSQSGVNLLMQRWTYHNSRAVIELPNFQEATSAEYEEADLTEDWVDQRTGAGLTPSEAMAEAHEWLRSASPSGSSWQDLLKDSSARSAVRTAMRRTLRER